MHFWLFWCKFCLCGLSIEGQKSLKYLYFSFKDKPKSYGFECHEFEQMSLSKLSLSLRTEPVTCDVCRRRLTWAAAALGWDWRPVGRVCWWRWGRARRSASSADWRSWSDTAPLRRHTAPARPRPARAETAPPRSWSPRDLTNTSEHDCCILDVTKAHQTVYNIHDASVLRFHSLQRIRWSDSDEMTHFSESDQETISSTACTAWEMGICCQL